MTDIEKACLEVYLSKGVEECDDYRRMKLMMRLYKDQITRDVQQGVLRAYDVTEDWDYRKDSDGCTGVSEVHSPKGTKFPPCVMHDHMRTMLVKKGLMSVNYCDWMFYKAQKQFGMSRFRSAVRALFVRFPAWYGWFRWRKRG